MKNKRKIKRLKILTSAILFIVITLLFIDWGQKKYTSRDFYNIGFKNFVNLPKTGNSDTTGYYALCKEVNEYVYDHPIELNIEMNCNDYLNNKDSVNIVKGKIDLINKIQKIDKEYTQKERSANNRLMLIFILSLILPPLFWYQIEKRSAKI